MIPVYARVFWYIWKSPRLFSQIARAFPRLTDSEIDSALYWLRDNGFIRYMHRWYVINGTAEKMRSLQQGG
jgi:hypothetical protein